MNLCFSNDFKDALNRFQDELSKRLQFTIPKTAIVVVVSLTVFTFMYFAFGPGLLTNLLGFAFPAFASFQAIESPDKEDDTQWLTYWVVFSAFSLFETFADILSDYFPMYFAFKFAFLIWLSSPNTRGAEFIYHKVIRPFLLENESLIDQRMRQGQEAVDEVATATKEIADEKAGDLIKEAKEIVQEAVNEANQNN